MSTDTDSVAHTLNGNDDSELAFVAIEDSVDTAEVRLDTLLHSTADGSATGNGRATAKSPQSAQPVWSLPLQQLVDKYCVSVSNGLTLPEATRRLDQYGPNTVPPSRQSFWSVLKEEITEPLILLLLAVGVLYFVFGQLEEAFTVLAIITVCVLIEIGTEWRAKNALALLSSHSLVSTVSVKRNNGQVYQLPASQLVPGDIIELITGQSVPADGRLVDSAFLSVDESALTGESEHIHKQHDSPVSTDTPLYQRTNMLYSGTLVTQGFARLLVVNTGQHTITGAMIDTIRKRKRKGKTPLQKSLKTLAFQLTVLAGVVVVVIAIIGFVIGMSYQQVILTSLALAFAVIPEELPILIKVVLAIGAVALSKISILVKSLKTAESLGGIDVCLTDKTGTLTKNQLRVVNVSVLNDRGSVADTATIPQSLLDTWIRSSPALHQQLSGTDSSSHSVDISAVRDRFDPALLHYLACAHSQSQSHTQYILHFSDNHFALLTNNDFTVENLFPFDNWRRRSSTIIQQHQSLTLYTRGALDSLLPVCAAIRRSDGAAQTFTEARKQDWLRHSEQLGRKGVRILAFASKVVDPSADIGSSDSATTSDSAAAAAHERELVFEGMVGFEDELRDNVHQTIQLLRAAGITVKMVTGDALSTGAAVAKSIGIIDSDSQASQTPIAESDNDSALTSVNSSSSVSDSDILCYCRMTPDDKLNLVKRHQLHGHQVLVTGDGFNDGPALSQADVGLSMGSNATDLALESAGLCLLNNDFHGLYIAISEGRKLLTNLMLAIRFYLTCKLCLLLLFFVSLVFYEYAPMKPLHIIVLECFMDLGASTAFTTEKNDRYTMKQPPSQWQRDQLLRGRKFWPTIIGTGLLMYAVIGGMFVLANNAVSESEAHTDTDDNETLVQSATFVTWLLTHVLLAHAMRTFRRSILFDSLLAFRTSGSDQVLTLASNKLLLVWTFLTVLFVIVALTVPALRSLLELADLTQSLTFSIVGITWTSGVIVPCVILPVSVYVLMELVKLVAGRSNSSTE